MFGSVTIEIAIGLIVVFILVSTICTAIREGIESMLKTRAAYLEQGIRQLLNDQTGTGLTSAIFNHPLVYGLFNGSYTPGKNTDKTRVFANGKNLPSYIPSKNFARALMDIAAKGVDTEVSTGATLPVLSLESIRENASKLGNPQIQRIVLNAIDMAEGDLNKAQTNLENWFNSGMDRVSGWYKRSTQSIIFAIALVVTVAMNVNAIAIIKHLSQNEAERKAIVEYASGLKQGELEGSDKYKMAQKELATLNLPIGWEGVYSSTNRSEFELPLFLTMLAGWLITALAATLGAPYWFDMLNKVMVIRSTVKPHEKSREEPSQDR